MTAQQWRDVEVVDLSPCSRGALKGKRGDGVSTHILLSRFRTKHSNTRMKYYMLFRVLFQKHCRSDGVSSIDLVFFVTYDLRLQDAFKFLFSDQDLDRRFVYLAITSSDSSIVYYKIGEGMVKPAL